MGSHITPAQRAPGCSAVLGLPLQLALRAWPMARYLRRAALGVTVELRILTTGDADAAALQV
jgi:hypothetical protein